MYLSAGTKTTGPQLSFKCYPSCKMTNTAEWGTLKIPQSLRMCRLSCMLNFQPHACDWCPFFHLSHCQCTILLIDAHSNSVLYLKMADSDLLPRPQAFCTNKLWEKLGHRPHAFKLYNMVEILRRFHSQFDFYTPLLQSGFIKVLISGLHPIV